MLLQKQNVNRHFIYYNSLVEKGIELKLKTSGAVVVAGPKFCGKTTTCMLYQKKLCKT